MVHKKGSCSWRMQTGPDWFIQRIYYAEHAPLWHFLGWGSAPWWWSPWVLGVLSPFLTCPPRARRQAEARTAFAAAYHPKDSWADITVLPHMCRTHAYLVILWCFRTLSKKNYPGLVPGTRWLWTAEWALLAGWSRWCPHSGAGSCFVCRKMDRSTRGCGSRPVRWDWERICIALCNRWAHTATEEARPQSVRVDKTKC